VRDVWEFQQERLILVVEWSGKIEVLRYEAQDSRTPSQAKRGDLVRFWCRGEAGYQL
jgi:hypothetical protein